jgi:hypothetical protein
LFNRQNKKEIEHHEKLMQKPGMGLHDEGASSLYSYVKSMSSDLISSDMSGWDWSVSEIDLAEDLKRRVYLNSSSGTVWEHLAQVHYFCISRKLMFLPNGKVFQQTVPGVMPSGWRNTSSTNSAIRCMLHCQIAVDNDIKPDIIANGDDSIETRLPNVEYNYGLYSKSVRDVQTVNVHNFPFCSHNFVNGIAIPDNPDKTIYKLLLLQVRDRALAMEIYAGISFHFRHQPHIMEQVNSLLELTSWWSPSEPPSLQ